MTVARRYDEFTQLYVEVNLDAPDQRTGDRRPIDGFAAAASGFSGVALDVGCGPGHVTDHLARAGVEVVGHDISANMVVHAKAHYPDRPFAVADMAALPHPGAGVGGILSR